VAPQQQLKVCTAIKCRSIEAAAGFELKKGCRSAICAMSSAA
jgi:hypothetical protein